mmetsp:Transcript_96056/g.271909  ORF Transcript_96056/g.271909 Transcript_96056/m.271909 type:complete len:231 (-) Transcript_96056:128-820(-)|eukprot:CAMPEP_0179292788 /NCGR_PEP_ID=MMETSP0797-20121207/43037_1 /TAXON_ID=47934 /ORGANISM="Dinophysis acuminata, Strain DAEP01" /LENGTH=230 /DNA_ID=CAMNT_0021001913 /DNA_START=100 /DNA_END=792 /DNA_ORIENTATION=+
MRAIFILVFTAVQANALAPRGLATPPGITQSLRRVVRRLGRKMGISIRTRRATRSMTNEGEICCLVKEGEAEPTEQIEKTPCESAQENTANKITKVILPDNFVCDPSGKSGFETYIPQSASSLHIKAAEIKNKYFAIMTKSPPGSGEGKTAQGAIAEAASVIVLEKTAQATNEMKRTINNAVAGLGSSKDAIERTEAEIKILNDSITQLEKDKGAALAAIDTSQGTQAAV